jgi:adenine phosphoribosyltransferase
MSAAAAAERLVRDIPDFPEPGIVYKDITPLLADPAGFDAVLTAMTTPWADIAVDVVVGIEARGFIFGAAIARELGVGFVPIRKPGKLPFMTTSVDYGLEYGTDTLEMHIDAISAGQKVVVIDDVLATGGTASAAVELIAGQGGDVAGFGFLLELGFLDGRSKLGGARIESLIAVGDTAVGRGE